jgi:prephenate dehydrogenase
MQHVTIVGLGLIGASIGLGLKRWSSENARNGQAPLEVIGFDLELEHQSLAKKIGAVDRTEWELRKAVRDADLLVLATPVVAMREIMGDVAEFLRPGAVITDTASTKQNVLQWSGELLPTTVDFVGGHPMAGKSESIEGADGTIFQGATWCVTPSVRASEESVRTVLGMVSALGAEAYFVDPVEHDAFVAGISHLPFVVSASIMNALTADPAWKDMKTLTAGGFRDVTRLASGSPEMHRDIALTNQESIARWIDATIAQLEIFRDALRRDDEATREEIGDFLTNARDRRAEWAVQTSREAEMLGPESTAGLRDGLGDQMSRMFFGGLMRKKRTPGPSEREASTRQGS